MTDFKAGDKVRVANIYGGTSDERVGAEGTIKQVRTAGDAFSVKVENKGHCRFGQALIFYQSELELIKPEPKFAVGDWVKVQGRNDEWDGTVGTVQKVGEKGFGSYGTLYTIHKDDKAADELRFFEKVLEATEAPAAFKVGTIVTFADLKNDRWQGGKAEVIEGRGWGRFTTRVRIIEGPPKNDMYRNYKGAELNFDPAHLKLWEASKPTLKAGDEVTFVMEGFKPWQGGKGIVKEGPLNLYGWESYEVTVTEVPPANQSIRVGHTTGFKPEWLEAVPEQGQWKLAEPVNQESKPEAVEHPAHYGGDTTYEVIKVAEAWGFEKNAYLFNALKYLGRAGNKGSKVEDLKKLVFYAEREIALEEAK